MSTTRCTYPDCTEPMVASCDLCDRDFCEQHGRPGGDRGTEYGDRAYPSSCWNCSDADEHARVMGHPVFAVFSEEVRRTIADNAITQRQIERRGK